jgi:hypothetical protein
MDDPICVVCEMPIKLSVGMGLGSVWDNRRDGYIHPPCLLAENKDLRQTIERLHARIDRLQTEAERAALTAGTSN